MANPDFTSKIDSTIIAAFQNAQQQRLQEQQLHDQEKQQSFKNTLETSQAIGSLVSGMVTQAEKRKTTDLVAQAKTLLSKPAPSPTVVPEGPTMDNSLLAPVPNPEVADRKKAMLNIAGALAPRELGEQVAKQAFPEAPKAVNPANLQSKSILLNGQPAEALFNPDNGTFSDPISKQPLTGDIKPYSSTVQTELTDADRKRLLPLAKAVVEGRALPSALVNTRGGDKEKLAQVVAETDPQFDLSMAPQRVATRKDFSSGGQTGKTLTSLNTVIGHLDTLADKIQALDNNKVVKANKLANYLQSETGNPAVTGFNATKALVVGELGKVAQGSGVVTNEERHQFEESLNSSQSKEQAQEAVDTFIDLMKSRTDSIKANWEQTMGGNTPPVPFINAKSKEKLVKHGYDPETLEKKQKTQSGSSGVDDIAKLLGLKKKGS